MVGLSGLDLVGAGLSNPRPTDAELCSELLGIELLILASLDIGAGGRLWCGCSISDASCVLLIGGCSDVTVGAIACGGVGLDICAGVGDGVGVLLGMLRGKELVETTAGLLASEVPDCPKELPGMDDGSADDGFSVVSGFADASALEFVGSSGAAGSFTIAGCSIAMVVVSAGIGPAN
jgi:hypothetical protein